MVDPEMKEESGMDIALIEEVNPLSLNSDTRGLLYRAIRELLFNVQKHAQTNYATVSILYPDQCVKIHVEDQGIGSDSQTIASEQKYSFGLFSIRERIQFLSGSMKCTSKKGLGTKITLTIPLEPHGEP